LLQIEQQQQNEVRSLLKEQKEKFSDVPKVTNLIEHKDELTQREPVRCKHLAYSNTCECKNLWLRRSALSGDEARKQA